MSREAIDRAYMHTLTIENLSNPVEDRVRACLKWVQEVSELVPEEVMRPMAITLLRDVANPILDDEGQPMVAQLMHLMLRKCGCMEEEKIIADKLELIVADLIERRNQQGNEGEEWKDV